MNVLVRRGACHLIPLAQQAMAASSVTLAVADPLQLLNEQPSLNSCLSCVQRVWLHYTTSAQQHQAAEEVHGSSTGSSSSSREQCCHEHRREQHPQEQSKAGESLSFEHQEHTCWSCHERFDRGSLVCQRCNRIQPVDSSLTFFDLMGYQQPAFDVDLPALEKRYKLLQWQLHPDKSAGKTPEEKQYSAEQATRINQAYGVLRNALLRANYMLVQAGVSEEEFERTVADPELVMEVMEAREEVEQEHGREQLLKLHSESKQHQAMLCEHLAGAFGRADIDSARQLVAQLSYCVRLEEAICDKL